MIVELQLYLAWLVPSSISFLASCAVIYYILWLNPGFKDKIFHQVSLFLAAADILQCCAWFIGVKYSATYNQCAAQEYIFQAGTIFKAVGNVFICAVAAHTISARRNPSYKERRSYIVACVTISLFFLALSMSFQSARLFCDANIEKYSEASWEMKLAILSYFFAFATPVYLCSVVDVAFFLLMKFKLNELLGTNLPSDTTNRRIPSSSERTTSQQSGESDNSMGTNYTRNAEIVLVVNRLIFYPLVFFLGWIPGSVALSIIIATGRDTLVARLITNATAASTGWASVLSYFYFEWKIQSARAEKPIFLSEGIPNSSAIDTSFVRSSDETDQTRPSHICMPRDLESDAIRPSEILSDDMLRNQHQRENEEDYNEGSRWRNDKAHSRQVSHAMHIEFAQNDK